MPNLESATVPSDGLTPPTWSPRYVAGTHACPARLGESGRTGSRRIAHQPLELLEPLIPGTTLEVDDRKPRRRRGGRLGKQDAGHGVTTQVLPPASRGLDGQLGDRRRDPRDRQR